MEPYYSLTAAEKMLLEPAAGEANRLCVLTAYATPSMVSWLLTKYAERSLGEISVELIVESTVDNGIDINSHEGFKELERAYSGRGNGKFRCSYLHQTPVSESSYFIWLRNDEPLQAFACSYEFTQASLLRTQNGSFNRRSAEDAYEMFKNTLSRTIYCSHAEVEEYVIIKRADTPQQLGGGEELEKCTLPLITARTGEPGKKSGLNWGQRNRRNRNEAYIPLPRKVAKSGFFPLNKQHFLVITDDRHTLQLRVEQQDDKAITTPESNALLGEYFRNRLGLANGAYVNAEDLRAYGRTDVTFYKIDDEQYYMDFSV